MQLVLLAMLILFKPVVDSLPQNVEDTSTTGPLSPDLDDPALIDIASANAPPNSDGQSNPITFPSGGSGPLIANSDTVAPESEYPKSFVSTDSIASNEGDPGLLVAISTKESYAKPFTLDTDDDLMASCPAHKRFHCCEVIHWRLRCHVITSASQWCSGSASEFIMCCPGLKHLAPTEKKPKWGLWPGCVSVIWTPKPKWHDKAQAFALNNWNKVLHKIKDIQEQSPAGNDLIQPNNLP